MSTTNSIDGNRTRRTTKSTRTLNASPSYSLEEGLVFEEASAALQSSSPPPAPKYSFEDLVLSERGTLLINAFRKTRGDLAVAEDIVQETLVRAFKAWSGWKPHNAADPASSARGWLSTIETNVWYTYLDSLKRHRDHLAIYSREQALLGETSTSPDEVSLTDEQTNALEVLVPEHRAVIELCVIQEKTYEQAAEVLGVERLTIATRLHRAKRNARENLEAAKNPAPVVVVRRRRAASK